MLKQKCNLRTVSFELLIIFVLGTFLSICFFISPVKAEVSLPNGCVFGRSEDPNNIISIPDNINFNYLRIEGPSYVLQGESSRFKGNLADIYAYVRFFNSEKGYVGRDKSNFEANAYKSMTFDTTYGNGLAWIVRGPTCSAKDVWVQKKPTISKRSLTGGDELTASVNFALDKYSEYFQKKVNPRVTFFWRNEAGLTGSQIVRPSGTSGVLTTNINVSGGGPISVRAIIFDGNFNNSVELGDAVVKGPIQRRCKDCEIY